jgi:FtsZ-binding cell division protein ZapB
MSEEEHVANGEDDPFPIDTIPVRQTTVNEMLRALHEATNELRETRNGVAVTLSNFIVEMRTLVGNMKSDIKELRGGARAAQTSVADLKAEALEAENASLRAARQKWADRGWELLKWLVVATVGGLGKVAWDVVTKK